MSRRGWASIAVATVVNAVFVTTVIAIDDAGAGSAGHDSGTRPRVRTVVDRAAATTTTYRPDPVQVTPTPTTPEAQVEHGTAPVVSRVDTTDRVVFITIDDGLIRDPAVIDTIRRMDVPVSLFLVEGLAEQGQDYFRELIALGASVHSHTTSHEDLRGLGWSAQATEICDPADTITELFDQRATLFRPPYGAYDETTQAVAGYCGYDAVVAWAGAANDGRIDLQAGALQPGDIILFHFRTDLAQNLEVLEQMSRDQGFRIGRLEDYLVSS
ncbi:MAG TPA: polysaccharide deacetylase family protein [Acidimicrobiia bacterium]|nr:polysaccharide deacetylase family protein [Acidimicrobiia bacterium]